MLGVAQQTIAIAIAATLLGLFGALLLRALVRARAAPASVPRHGAWPMGERRAGLPGRVVSRREFFRRSLVTSFLVFAAQFGGASLAFLWPRIRGGFGARVVLPDPPDAIRTQIRESRQPYYLGAGRFYLIEYRGTGDRPGGIYEGLTAQGLMALFQKCPHLGCRVPFCQQSQWFECPCHGSKYNAAGEYRLGPAPTGMHRFKVSVEGGRVVVDTGTIIPGPPRGTDTIGQTPEGPFCV